MPDGATVLAEILRELSALRSEVACLRVPRLAAADYATLARLLPTIRDAVNVRLFSVADLIEHAKLPTPEARALRVALGTLDARRIGKLFARALGVHVEGLLVQHVGEDRGAAVWSIGVAFPAEKPAALHDTAQAPRSTGSTVKTSRGK